MFLVPKLWWTSFSIPIDQLVTYAKSMRKSSQIEMEVFFFLAAFVSSIWWDWLFLQVSARPGVKLHYCRSRYDCFCPQLDNFPFGTSSRGKAMLHLLSNHFSMIICSCISTPFTSKLGRSIFLMDFLCLGVTRLLPIFERNWQGYYMLTFLVNLLCQHMNSWKRCDQLSKTAKLENCITIRPQVTTKMLCALLNNFLEFQFNITSLPFWSGTLSPCLSYGRHEALSSSACWWETEHSTGYATG